MKPTLVAVKMSKEQLSLLDKEVIRRRREETSELRITRSSVMRAALMEMIRQRKTNA